MTALDRAKWLAISIALAAVYVVLIALPKRKCG